MPLPGAPLPKMCLPIFDEARQFKSPSNYVLDRKRLIDKHLFLNYEIKDSSNPSSVDCWYGMLPKKQPKCCREKMLRIEKRRFTTLFAKSAQWIDGWILIINFLFFADGKPKK
jgi:hypothetical protein